VNWLALHPHRETQHFPTNVFTPAERGTCHAAKGDLMKHTLLTAAFVFALGGSVAFAQQAQPAPDQQPPAPIQQQPPPQQAAPHRMPNPHREAMRLSKQLGLTQDQTAKLEPVLANREQQMEAIRSNTQLSQQDARRQTRDLTKSTQDQLANILTPDQMNQMKAMRKERGAGNGAGQQPPPPPPAA
jgi:protein CpxP